MAIKFSAHFLLRVKQRYQQPWATLVTTVEREMARQSLAPARQGRWRFDFEDGSLRYRVILAKQDRAVCTFITFIRL